jgi:hypothetical protein
MAKWKVIWGFACHQEARLSSRGETFPQRSYHTKQTLPQHFFIRLNSIVTLIPLCVFPLILWFLSLELWPELQHNKCWLGFEFFSILLNLIKINLIVFDTTITCLDLKKMYLKVVIRVCFFAVVSEAMFLYIVPLFNQISHGMIGWWCHSPHKYDSFQALDVSIHWSLCEWI